MTKVCPTSPSLLGTLPLVMKSKQNSPRIVPNQRKTEYRSNASGNGLELDWVQNGPLEMFLWALFLVWAFCQKQRSNWYCCGLTAFWNVGGLFSDWPVLLTSECCWPNILPGWLFATKTCSDREGWRRVHSRHLRKGTNSGWNWMNDSTKMGWRGRRQESEVIDGIAQVVSMGGCLESLSDFSGWSMFFPKNILGYGPRANKKGQKTLCFGKFENVKSKTSFVLLALNLLFDPKQPVLFVADQPGRLSPTHSSDASTARGCWSSGISWGGCVFQVKKSFIAVISALVDFTVFSLV